MQIELLYVISLRLIWYDYCDALTWIGWFWGLDRDTIMQDLDWTTCVPYYELIMIATLMMMLIKGSSHLYLIR